MVADGIIIEKPAVLVRDAGIDFTRSLRLQSHEAAFRRQLESVMTHATAITRLRSVTPVFLVGDIAATMDWYQRVLGFEADAVPKVPPHNFCILQKDDVAIFLQLLAGYQKPDLYNEREGGVWSAYLRTEGVHRLYEELKGRADVEVIQPLHRQPYRQTEFEIRDPNGYVLVFAEPW
jgi:uncharacterized glyoxalase superfamily protein PhnB